MSNSQKVFIYASFINKKYTAGAYTTLTLFGLRVSVDLPVYTITYARSQGFLIINLIATIPTIAAFFAVALYFTVRSVSFKPCHLCNIRFLEVKDIEEEYVRCLMNISRIKKRVIRCTSAIEYAIYHLFPRREITIPFRGSSGNSLRLTYGNLTSTLLMSQTC